MSSFERLMLFNWQVISAFLCTCVLTVLMAIAHSILTLSLDKDIYIVDQIFAAPFRSIFARRLPIEIRLVYISILERVIFSFMDQQLLLGLAYACAGLFRRCSISVYHFQLIADLVWFSALTYGAALFTLDMYFQERRRARNLRVCLIAFMGAIMITFVVLTSHDDWYKFYSSDAQCLFNTLVGHVHGIRLLLAITLSVLYFLDYTVSIIRLYETPAELLDNYVLARPQAWLRKRIETRLKDYDKNMSGTKVITGLTALASWLVIGMAHKLLVWFLDAHAPQILLNLLFLILGISWINEDRSIAQGHVNGNENDMSVGQIVPVFILISTVFIFREAVTSVSGCMCAKLAATTGRLEVECRKCELKRRPDHPAAIHRPGTWPSIRAR